MYSVITSDGNAYGPVDLATLKTWCAEGRVTQNTTLREEATGRSLRAGDLPDLSGFWGAPTSPPPMSPPQPQGSVGATGNAYPQPPGSPYFRPSQMGVNPADLAGFNWGAFLLNWIWGCNHKKLILLIEIPIAFIPFAGGLINLGIGIWAGINGYKWAWESGRFSTVQEMRECQRIWTAWGVGLLIGGLVLGFVAGIIIAMSGVHPR